MSSTFKCMSVNPVDKCMWMKIGVYIGVEYGKKYPSDQSAYYKSILWYNKERSIILYATDKRIFFLQINWKNILHITYTGIAATWVEKS